MLNSNHRYALKVATLLAVFSFPHAQISVAEDNPPDGLAPQSIRQLSLSPIANHAAEGNDGLQRYPQPPTGLPQKIDVKPAGKRSRGSKEIAKVESYEPEAVNPERSYEFEAPLVVLPEVTREIKLSASDVNRFVCTSGEINDVPISSEEKGVIIHYSGRDAFVKFKVMKRSDGKLGYSTTPTEIFIVCGGSTYSVIAHPSRIRSRTVRLGTGTEDRVEKNQALYAGLPFEKRVMRLIKEAYTDNLPDSYTIAERNFVDNTWRSISIVLKREVEVDGEGLRLKEYHISPRPGHKGTINLSEKMFLRKEFALNPLGVSIDKHKLEQSDIAKLFIVEQKSDQPLGGNGLQFMTIDDVGAESIQQPKNTSQNTSMSNKPRMLGGTAPKVKMPQQTAEVM